MISKKERRGEDWRVEGKRSVEGNDREIDDRSLFSLFSAVTASTWHRCTPTVCVGFFFVSKRPQGFTHTQRSYCNYSPSSEHMTHTDKIKGCIRRTSLLNMNLCSMPCTGPITHISSSVLIHDTHTGMHT